MINASANQSATAASAAAAARPGSLLAREHGAYGQLGVPLVTALLIGGLTPGSLLLAGTAVSAFLAHEPLLVLLGHRGSRRRRLDGDRAAKRMLLLGAIFAILAGAALVLMPAPARLAAAVPALLMVVLAAFITRGRERSGAGEIVAAMALSACSLPVVTA